MNLTFVDHYIGTFKTVVLILPTVLVKRRNEPNSNTLPLESQYKRSEVKHWGREPF